MNGWDRELLRQKHRGYVFGFIDAICLVGIGELLAFLFWRIFL
jgi:hypothetical protein